MRQTVASLVRARCRTGPGEEGAQASNASMQTHEILRRQAQHPQLMSCLPVLPPHVGGSCWRVLEAKLEVLRHHGGILEVSWRLMEALGGSWRHLGRSWKLLEASWRDLDASWRLLEALGGILESLGGILEVLEGI